MTTTGSMRLEAGCGCSGGAHGTSGTRTERPRWFGGQIVGPADLTAQADWMLDRLRRHNRMLHGWGVACGLAVAVPADDAGTPLPFLVDVAPGYACAPTGDEIVVERTVRIDVRQARPSAVDPCADPADPWCAPVRTRRDPDLTYYLAVRYAEWPTTPVRAAACGCGCDDDPCEYSRTHEGWAFTLLDALPDGHGAPDEPDRVEAVTCGPRIAATGTRPCPDPPDSPWVVLADLTVSGIGTVTVDPLAHRRFMASAGRFSFTCAPGEPQDRRLTGSDRSAIAGQFSGRIADEVEAEAPSVTRDRRAATLRGVAQVSGLAGLLGTRTIAELAAADRAGMLAEAAGAGVDADAVRHAQDRARLVTRIVDGAVD